MSKSQKKSPFFKQEILNYGPYFTPEYQSLGIEFRLDGTSLNLTPLQEYFLCRLHKMLIKGDLTPKFKKNFYNSFISLITTPNSQLASLSIEQFFRIRPEKGALDKFRTPQPIKEDLERHQFVKVDGKMLKVQNPIAEYHTIFNDRSGLLSGTIKLRVYPKDMTINTSIPNIKPPAFMGDSYKRIITDPLKHWLVHYVDKLTNKQKYLLFDHSTHVRSSRDIIKFYFVQGLKGIDKKIKQAINTLLSENTDESRQKACCIYLLWLLGIRIGGEKEQDNDVVGITSLYMDSILLQQDNKIDINFQGKDNVSYQRAGLKVKPKIYEIIKSLQQEKRNTLFTISPQQLNAELSRIHPRMTAKDIRTFRCSTFFSELVDQCVPIKQALDQCSSTITPNIKKDFIKLLFIYLNSKISYFCNHFKGGKLKEETLLKYKKQKKILQQKLKIAQSFQRAFIRLQIYKIDTQEQQFNLDPRIIVKFSKLFQIPLTDLFSKSELVKYQWALDTPATFEY